MSSNKVQRHSIHRLGVIPGYRCNFSCAHCIVGSKKNLVLTSDDKANIVEAVTTYNVRSLFFVGGEPTLYVREINDLLSRLPEPGNMRVRITTNGHFASTKASAARMLASVNSLEHVQLSYDRFHREFLPLANIKNLHEACMEADIKFNVMLVISSPLDLLMAGELQKIGDFRIAVQQVLSVGRAKKNGIEYSYPEFDKKVLSKFCPNRDKITYMCGEGFSACCSSLFFNSGSVRLRHPKLKEHLGSEFYRLISNKSFGQLLRHFRVPKESLTARHSAPCNLCEHIFRTAYGKDL